MKLILLVSFFVLSYSSKSFASLTCESSRRIVSYVNNLHYLNPEITEDFFLKISINFLDSLDKENLFLTKEEYKIIKNNLKLNNKKYFKNFKDDFSFGLMFSKMNLYSLSGDFNSEGCLFVDVIYNEIEKGKNRYFEVYEKARNYKGKISDKKITFTEKEINDKSLRKKLLNYFAKELRITDKNKIFEVESLYRLRSKESSDLKYSRFLHSYLILLDPHSEYIPQKDTIDFLSNINEEYKGFGIAIQKEKYELKILEIIKGSPADKTGLLKKDDLILEFNGTNVEDLNLKEVSEVLSDEPEKGVFKIKRSNEIIEVSLEKKKYTSENRTFEVKKIGEKLIFYAHLERFSSNDSGVSTSVEFYKAYLEAKLTYKKIDGIIIDLRDNLGGMVSEVLALSQLFVGDKPILREKNNRGYINTFENQSLSGSFAPKINEKLVVLVNEYSASASEIFAGTIKAYNRGIVVGSEFTYGKGSVQRIEDLSFLGLGSFKVTIAIYFLDDGKTPQGHGIKSDIIIIPSTKDLIKEKSLKNVLIESEAIESLVENKKEIIFIDKLQKLSGERIKLFSDATPTDVLNEAYNVLSNYIELDEEK